MRCTRFSVMRIAASGTDSARARSRVRGGRKRSAAISSRACCHTRSSCADSVARCVGRRSHGPSCSTAPRRNSDSTTARNAATRRPARRRHAQPLKLQPRLIRRRRVMRGQTLTTPPRNASSVAGDISRSPTATAGRGRKHRTAGRLRARRYAGAVGPPRRQCQQRAQCSRRIRLIQRRQLREPLRRAPAAPRRKRIDHHAAADGARRRRIAQHQPIARQRTDRPIQRQPREHGARLVRSDRHPAPRPAPSHAPRRDADAPAHRHATRAPPPRSSESRMSKRAVGACTSGCSTQSPRVTASFDSRGPVTFSATR